MYFLGIQRVEIANVAIFIILLYNLKQRSNSATFVRLYIWKEYGMDTLLEGVSASAPRSLTTHRMLLRSILACVIILALLMLDVTYTAVSLVPASAFVVALLVSVRVFLWIDCEMDNPCCFVCTSGYVARNTNPHALNEQVSMFFLTAAGVFALHIVWQIVWFVIYASLGVYEEIPRVFIIVLIDIALVILSLAHSVIFLDD